MTVLDSVGVDVRSLISSEMQNPYDEGLPGANFSGSDAVKAIGTLLGVGTDAHIDASANMVASTALYGRDSFNDSMTGTQWGDYFFGRGGIDTINGGKGDDWIDGGAGADIIDGGAGTDVLHFDKTTAGVTVDLYAGTGLGEDTFEVLLAGINNKVNACVAVQPEVISVVKKVLVIATIPFQPQFPAWFKIRENANKRAA